MKRKITKKNFLAGRKMLVLTIVCAMLLACMSGCGEKQEADVSEMTEKATDAEEEASEKVETNEAEVEESAEQTKEDFFKETVEPWLIETGKQGIALAVWNEVDNTMYVIGEGEDYTRKEGDRFFLCTPSIMMRCDVVSSCINETGSTNMTMSEVMDGYDYNYYWEVFYEKAESGINELGLDVQCKNGETGKIQFNLLEVGGGISEIPEGCDYYLESSTGVKLLGANTPEGFEDLRSTPRLLLWIDGDENISVTTSSSHKDIFEGLASNISGENELTVNGEETTFSYSEDYSEKGTYDTIYGQAHLYDLVSTEQYSGEEATLMYGEMAILLIKGEYVTINYYFVDEHTHDIVWVLQQLFE